MLAPSETAGDHVPPAESMRPGCCKPPERRRGDSGANRAETLPPAPVSVVVPVYNERENVPRLYEALTAALEPTHRPCEIIFVDDGSRDGTAWELEALAAADPRVRVIEFRQNFGQTAALSAGIEAARGEIIVTIDGDLQNDPADIPLMLERIEAGYDLVHGRRSDRKDGFWSRRLPSWIANRLISRVTGTPVRDLGCTLKAMRREFARELRLYGEMHRFIPVLAWWRGARCCEMETRHHPRRFGKSKYGLSRGLRVLLDLITVKFLVRYLVSPMRLFGGVGLACLAAGLLSAAATVWMKLAAGTDMTGNPLLLLAVVAVIAGIQFLGIGLLGELGSRIYFELKTDRPYAVRRTLNLGRDEGSVDSRQSVVNRRMVNDQCPMTNGGAVRLND